MISANSSRRRCHILTSEDVITDRPISGPVGAGHGKPDDIRMVQRFLNALLPAEGGPDLVLAEDGICGPKTQAAINKYQKFAVGFVDGRIDPQGKTIRALTGFIVGSPTVPQGIARPERGRPARRQHAQRQGPADHRQRCSRSRMRSRSCVNWSPVSTCSGSG